MKHHNCIPKNAPLPCLRFKRNDALLHRLDAIDFRRGIVLDKEIESININEQCECLSNPNIVVMCLEKHCINLFRFKQRLCSY